MSVLIQYDFFQTPEESEIEALKKEIERLRVSGDRVRKGTYAKIGEIKKMQIELEERLIHIEKGLCKR